MLKKGALIEENFYFLHNNVLALPLRIIYNKDNYV